MCLRTGLRGGLSGRVLHDADRMWNRFEALRKGELRQRQR